MTTTFAEIAEYEDEHGKVVSGGVRTLDEMLQSSSDALREIGRQLKEVSDKKVVAKKMADKKVAAPTAPAPVEFPQRKPERTYAAFRARLEELERMEAQAEADAREPAKLSKKWNKGFLDKPRKPVAPPPAVLLDTPREPVAPPRAVTPTSQPAKKTVRFEDDDGLEKKDATSKEPRPKAPPLPSSRNKPAFAGFVGRVRERSSAAPTTSSPPVVDNDQTMPYRNLSRFRRLRREQMEERGEVDDDDDDDASTDEGDMAGIPVLDDDDDDDEEEDHL